MTVIACRYGRPGLPETTPETPAQFAGRATGMHMDDGDHHGR